MQGANVEVLVTGHSKQVQNNSWLLLFQKHNSGHTKGTVLLRKAVSALMLHRHILHVTAGDAKDLYHETCFGSGAVQNRQTHLEKVVEQVWVLLQVEADSLVVHLHAADLDSHILEQDMLPGHRAVVHHHHGCIVVLVVLYVQEDQLLPVVELLTHTDEAGDVDACAEQLQVLHQLLNLVPAAGSMSCWDLADMTCMRFESKG